MKKMVVWVTIFVFTFLTGFSATYAQNLSQKDLNKQIKKLQEELDALQTNVDELSERSDRNEAHSVMDRINFSFELKTTANSIQYDNMWVNPKWLNSMYQLWSYNRLAVPADQIGGTLQGEGSGFTFNPAFLHSYGDSIQPIIDIMKQLGMITGNGFIDMNGNGVLDAGDLPSITSNSLGTPYFSDAFGAADLPLYQEILRNSKLVQADNDNDLIYTTRLRINMDSQINDNLKFSGRLTMYKVWGNGSDSSVFSSQTNSMLNDGNDTSSPSDDKLRVERAYFTYSNDNWYLAIGRLPTTDGVPMNYKNYEEPDSILLATNLNRAFDGISLGFNLEDQVGLPGFTLEFFYGILFESGWGNSYSLNSMSDIDDSYILGIMADLYHTDNLKITFNYAHAFHITDKITTGTSVFPFLVDGQDIDNDGEYDEYYISANTGSYVSRIEPTNNLGSADFGSLMIQGKLGNLTYYAAGNYNFKNPHNSDHTMDANYILWDLYALINSNNNPNGRPIKRHGTQSFWTGLIYDFDNQSRFGIEYTKNATYQFAFGSGEDSIIASKSQVRGEVYEIYYIYPFYGKNFFLTACYQNYNYTTVLSGIPVGDPSRPGSENHITMGNSRIPTALGRLTPTFDRITNVSVSLTVRF